MQGNTHNWQVGCIEVGSNTAAGLNAYNYQLPFEHVILQLAYYTPPISGNTITKVTTVATINGTARAKLTPLELTNIIQGYINYSPIERTQFIPAYKERSVYCSDGVVVIVMYARLVAAE